MKQEIVNQTSALLCPSIVIRSSIHSLRVAFHVQNYSSQNIAIHFDAQLYYDEQMLDEKTLPVIGFTGSGFVTATAQTMHFPISQDHFNNRKKLSFKYYFFDRTGKFKFNGEIKSLHKDNVEGVPIHLKI